MSAGWVAGSTRGKALVSSRLGANAAMGLARQPSIDDAARAMAASCYGLRVRPGQSLQEMQHAVAETVLWNLRVLAGWLPADGTRMLRALAGWFEISNTSNHLRALRTGASFDPFALGSLATVWPRVAAATNAAQVRRSLAGSTWGDPGSEEPPAVRLAMQARWVSRVHASLPRPDAWLAPAAALLATRVMLLEGQRLTGPAARNLDCVLPGLADSSWSTVSRVIRRLSRSGRDSVTALIPLADDVPERGSPQWLSLADALWGAELSWWDFVETEAERTLARFRFLPDGVVAAALLMGADARRVRAALGAVAAGAAGQESAHAVA